MPSSLAETVVVNLIKDALVAAAVALGSLHRWVAGNACNPAVQGAESHCCSNTCFVDVGKDGFINEEGFCK